MERSKELYDSQVGIEFEFLRRDNFPAYKVKKELEKLLGVKIQLEQEAHSDFIPTDNHFKLEKDYSGGENLLELVTSPLNFSHARIVIMTMLKWMRNTKGVYTNNKCGLHLNLNFPNKRYIEDLDILKFILNFDESKVYQRFPDRKDNIYTKSIKSIKPIHSTFDFANIMLSKNSFKYPNTKYYGINFSKLAKNYLEFRYIGGKKYEEKQTEILELLDYFLESLKTSYNSSYDASLKSKLETILEKHKPVGMAGKSHFNFKNIFRNITITVDNQTHSEIIKSFFPKIWNGIYPVLSNIMDLKLGMKGIINFDTDTGKLEFQNFFLKKTLLETNAIFYECTLQECVLLNQQIYDCDLTSCDLVDTKSMACNIKTTRIKNQEHISGTFDRCYLDGDIMIEDSEIKGGIFRKGKYSNCDIDDSVEVIDAEEIKKDYD